MKRTHVALLATVLVAVMMFAEVALAGDPGHGGLKGPHYNLNIIGVPQAKKNDVMDNRGHRIFVNLEGNSKIWLIEGEDFEVMDANATDKDGGKFMLPNPEFEPVDPADPDGGGYVAYRVYIRELGKPNAPGEGAVMTTCGVDSLADPTVTYCSTESVILFRDKGQPKFRNVSKELLTLVVDLDGDGHYERIGLFDEALQGYYWNYDNNGLRHVQLRFYMIPYEW